MTNDKTVTMSRELTMNTKIEPDEIHQMAFEEGQPAENGDGHNFTAEEFDLFVERLLTAATPVVERQEPVGYACADHIGNFELIQLKITAGVASDHMLYDKPLYTSPPAPVAVAIPKTFSQMLGEAQEVVRSKITWRKFIKSTPLDNDIAVWMVEFARAQNPVKDQSRRSLQGEMTGLLSRVRDSGVLMPFSPILFGEICACLDKVKEMSQ